MRPCWHSSTQFKISLLFLLYIVHPSLGKCVIPVGQIAKVYQTEEELSVPVPIGDLTTDVCSEGLNENNARFILFPSSQPFFDYFSIETAGSEGTSQIVSQTLNRQYLVLRQRLDREALCNDIIATRVRGVESLGSSMRQSNTFPPNCSCHPDLGWCSIYLQLALMPGRRTDEEAQLVEYLVDTLEFLIIEVRITDINDNAPLFSPPKYHLKISEAELAGSRFRLPSAHDTDLGRHAQINYRIAGVNISRPNVHLEDESTTQIPLSHGDQPDMRSPFSLKVNSITNEIFLQLESDLDRESTDAFYLHIVASDQGASRIQTGDLYLTVEVIDVNDFNPRFEQQQFVFSIAEDAPPGSVVGVVRAYDWDSGNNGQITYAIRDMNTPGSAYSPAVNRLRIDPHQGIIRVNGPLDRELEASLLLRIEATDHGVPPRTCSATVIVNLLDVNDNSPTIRLWGTEDLTDNLSGLVVSFANQSIRLISSPGFTQHTSIRVSEWLQSYSVITLVETSDPDARENGTVSCDIPHSGFSLLPVSNENNEMQVLQEKIGKLANTGQSIGTSPSKNPILVYRLISKIPLDRETTPVFHLPIICKDSGLAIRRTSTAILRLLIEDENDHSPEYEIPMVYPPAQWINRGAILQEVHNNLSNRTTGSGTSFLPPAKHLEITLPETCPEGHKILYLAAHDRDGKENARLKYKLLQSKSVTTISKLSPSDVENFAQDEHFIAVDSNSGTVTVTKSLKTITPNFWHDFEVIVEDHGHPVLSALLLLSIRVLIVNTVPPLLYVDGGEKLEQTGSSGRQGVASVYAVNISENQPPGTIVCRVLATDPDRGDAGFLSLRMVKSLRSTCNRTWELDSNTFSLSNLTGIITAIRTIDREVDGDLYVLTLEASDNGTPSKTSSITIHVNIQDANDNSPTFIFPLRTCHKSSTVKQTQESVDKFPHCTSASFRHAFQNKTNSVYVYNYSFVKYRRTPKPFDYMQSIVEFVAVDPDRGENSRVTYHLLPDCSMADSDSVVEKAMQELRQTFDVDNLSGCLHLLRSFGPTDVGYRLKFTIIAEDHGRPVVQKTAIRITATVSLNHMTLACRPVIDECQSHKALRKHSAIIPTSSPTTLIELTPAIRVLMGVTTVVGAIMIVIIIILFVRQPSWFFGGIRNRNRRQAPKCELFQCHEVHNFINDMGRRELNGKSAESIGMLNEDFRFGPAAQLITPFLSSECSYIEPPLRLISFSTASSSPHPASVLVHLSSSPSRTDESPPKCDCSSELISTNCPHCKQDNIGKIFAQIESPCTV